MEVKVVTRQPWPVRVARLVGVSSGGRFRLVRQGNPFSDSMGK